jgi:ribose transport system ATP-binding protein
MAGQTLMTNFLHMQGISKRFGAVVALDDVELIVKRGTVHALIGENGAGKSTLMKILSGSLQPDSGSMTLAGAPYAPRNPKEARAAGVSMIYQELTLAPHLTVEENVTLGAEKHSAGLLKHRYAEVQQALASLGHADIDLKMPVKQLGVGRQQIVEIARSLLLHSRLIVMDEPTSSLSAEDTHNLFEAIKRLRDQGVTLIYISHFLEEIQEIADDFTVLRDGAGVASGSIKQTTIPQIVTHMVGRSLDEMFPRVPHTVRSVILTAEKVNRPPRVQNVSFQLRSGEILGIAGLVGAGRTELLRCLFGLDAAVSGQMTIDGKNVTLGHSHLPQKSLALGFSMVSENRKEEGLAVRCPIRDNITYSSLSRYAGKFGRLDLQEEETAAVSYAAQVSLKYNRILDPLLSLSGGNQQKTALARLIADDSRILLLDEPTRGIDVASKVEIYTLIGELAASGCGIIMVSSYLPELLGICDSLAVMFRGSLSPVRSIAQWSEEAVMNWATTGKFDSPLLTN